MVFFLASAALLAMQLSTVYAACQSKCTDLKGSDGKTWKDEAGWTCQMYQDSANQGKLYDFCGSDGSGEACCFCGGGQGGDECQNNCQDKDGWKDTNGWTCEDYVWSTVNYCGQDDSESACCYCKGVADTVETKYCEDTKSWKDSAGRTCDDYKFEAEVGTNGQKKDNCGWENSADNCCFCGGGTTCKPCSPTQFFNACNDCRECVTAEACPAGQARTGCGLGNKGTCTAGNADAKTAANSGAAQNSTSSAWVIGIMLHVLVSTVTNR